MLVISNIKSEGIVNLDHVETIDVTEMYSNDNEKMYVLKISFLKQILYFGQWDTRVKAETALDKIVRAYHEGHRDVVLD